MSFLKNKKAVFFTFVAIFIVILIVAFVTTNTKDRYKEKAKAIASRVSTMNTFLTDFEKDVDRELFIGGYRALLSMNAYIRKSQSYVENFDLIFAQILVNGTVNGTEMELMKQGEYGADINSWAERLNEESSKINILLYTKVNDVRVAHTSPWDIEVVLNMTVGLRDTQNLAFWNYTKVYARQFSILGLEDPLYTIGTQDKVTNLINQTPNLDFINDSFEDVTVLTNHLTYSYYISSTDSPSFLMRFTGTLSPSPYGIESMINLEDLDVQNIPLQPRSVIDYIYFGNETTTNYCNVTDMPGWFRIDGDHVNTYELNLLNMTGCT